jgi:membrane dipeptidase
VQERPLLPLLVVIVAIVLYVMMSETDPLLLPRVNSSQSRHKTINDVDDVVVDQDAGDSPWRVNDAIAYCAVLITFVFLFVSILPDGFLKSWPHWGPSAPPTIDRRVDEILSNTPLIDGHNDLAIMIRVWYNNHIYGAFQKPFAEGGMPLHVDLPRLQEGRVGGAFWAAFVPCPPNGTDFSDGNYVESK